MWGAFRPPLSLTGRPLNTPTGLCAPRAAAPCINRRRPASQLGGNSDKDLLGGLPHVDARGGRVRPLCDGKVHPDGLVVDLHPSALLFGHLGLVRVLEIDKGEAPRSASLQPNRVSASQGAAPLAHLSVDDDLHARHCPVLAENVVNLVLRRVDVQPEHPQAVAGLRVVSGASVSPTAGNPPSVPPKHPFRSLTCPCGLGSRSLGRGRRDVAPGRVLGSGSGSFKTPLFSRNLGKPTSTYRE